MNEIIIKSKEEMNNFLRSNIVFSDSDVIWKCPKCKKENIGAYFSHPVPCQCKEFILPRLSDLDCDPASENLIRSAEIENLKNKIARVKEEISSLENDLSEKEQELYEYKKELKGWTEQE